MIGDALNNQQREHSPVELPEVLMEKSDFFREYASEHEKREESLGFACINEYVTAKKTLELSQISKKYLDALIISFFARYPADKLEPILLQSGIDFDLSRMTEDERLLPFGETPTHAAFKAQFRQDVAWPPSLQLYANIKNSLQQFPATIALLNYVMVELVAKKPFGEAMQQLKQHGFSPEIPVLPLSDERQRERKRDEAERQEQLQVEKEREQKKQESKKQAAQEGAENLEIEHRPPPLNLQQMGLAPAAAASIPADDLNLSRTPSPTYSPTFSARSLSQHIGLHLRKMDLDQEQEGSKPKTGAKPGKNRN